LQQEWPYYRLEGWQQQGISITYFSDKTKQQWRHLHKYFVRKHRVICLTYVLLINYGFIYSKKAKKKHSYKTRIDPFRNLNISHYLWQSHYLQYIHIPHNYMIKDNKIVLNIILIINRPNIQLRILKNNDMRI